ncbi:MAG: hypothetical protein FJ152_05570 [Firmicutes bacterium]|nr:hypothetical protein [Bacillota bacterium]
MKDNRHDKINPLGLVPNIIAFATSLAIAFFLKWEVRDLVWSLWFCSLVLGYLTLLSYLGAGAYIGLLVIKHPDFERKKRIPALAIGTAGGLFLLTFFSIHFGGFHAVHSVFLQSFFPVDGLPTDGFGRAFINPPLLVLMAFKYLFVPYGLFLIPTMIAERNHVFKPFYTLYTGFKTPETIISPTFTSVAGKAKLGRNPLGASMLRPYVNVVRMHLLIFFFAISYALKIDSFIVYGAVYLIYFFPWSDIRILFKKNN